MFKKFTRRDTYEDFTGDDNYYGEGFDEAEGVADDAYAPAAPTPVEPTSFGATAVSLKIVNPKGYDDASDIADYFKNGNTVLLNIEGLERMDALRLLDYLSGATRMVGGMMTKVGKTTIVVAPKSVDVSSIEAMVGEN